MQFGENSPISRRLITNQLPFMLLDKNDIVKNVLVSGGIYISDFEENYKHQLQLASYDFQLGDWFARQNENYFDEPKDSQSMWDQPKKLTEIILSPGELILGHSKEFFGTSNNISMTMATRSNAARAGISLCKCSDFANPQWFGRWTLEIQNSSKFHIVLQPGAILGQIQFAYTTAIQDPNSLFKNEKFKEIEKNMKKWTEFDILPYRSYFKVFRKLALDE
jgi:deoxycytidine triphosphate deaminase